MQERRRRRYVIYVHIRTFKSVYSCVLWRICLHYVGRTPAFVHRRRGYIYAFGCFSAAVLRSIISPRAPDWTFDERISLPKSTQSSRRNRQAAIDQLSWTVTSGASYHGALAGGHLPVQFVDYFEQLIASLCDDFKCTDTIYTWWFRWKWLSTLCKQRVDCAAFVSRRGGSRLCKQRRRSR